MKGIKCRFCGQSMARLMITALLQDSGCKTNNPADVCWARDEDGDPPLPHDFTEVSAERLSA